MPDIRIADLLKGFKISPIFVGAARAVINAAIVAGLAALNTQIHLIDWTQFGVVGAAVIAVLTGTGWAGLDQKIDPAQNETAEKRAAHPPTMGQ